MPLTLKEAYARTRRLRFLRNDEIIEARAALLTPADRDLVRATIIFGQPTSMIAKLGRISPTAVRRRVRSLVKRLGSQQFISAARCMHLLSDAQAAVAKHHLLEGKSLRATARATGMPYHEVRMRLTEIKGIIKGMKNLKENYPSLSRKAEKAGTRDLGLGTRQRR